MLENESKYGLEMAKKSSVLYNNRILSWYPNYKYVNTWILELIFKYLANENKFRFPDWRAFYHNPNKWLFI